MERLFNSRGKHIANFSNGQLYSPRGQNIGHLLDERGIFIDMHGYYLGEIVADDRLMRRRNSPYKNMNFGNRGNHGNIGNHGNPGNRGAIGRIAGYEDVEL